MRVSHPHSEVSIVQFNRLIQELLQGTLRRNTFQPWEVELLLDIEACALRESNRREVLRRYQKAANRDYQRGQTSLLKLSGYLERNREIASRRANGAAGDSELLLDE